MFQKMQYLAGVGLMVALIVFIPGIVLGGSTISIVAEVSDDSQVITDDDQVFEIVTDDKGKELLGHAGERVRLTGEIVEEGADRSIKVLSYEVLEEEEDEEPEDEESDGE